MLGTLQTTWINALRNAPVVQKNNINIVLAPDTIGIGVVNTPLPAIAIQITADKDSKIMIGGLIMDHFELQLAILMDFDNYSATKDNNIQENKINIPFEIRKWIENNKNGKYFKDLIDKYDFNATYRGLQPFKTVAKLSKLDKSIDVFNLIYDCTIVAKDESDFCGLSLETVNIKLNDIKIEQ